MWQHSVNEPYEAYPALMQQKLCKLSDVYLYSLLTIHVISQCTRERIYFSNTTARKENSPGTRNFLQYDKVVGEGKKTEN